VVVNKAHKVFKANRVFRVHKGSKEKLVPLALKGIKVSKAFKVSRVFKERSVQLVLTLPYPDLWDHKALKGTKVIHPQSPVVLVLKVHKV